MSGLYLCVFNAEKSERPFAIMITVFPSPRTPGGCHCLVDYHRTDITALLAATMPLPHLSTTYAFSCSHYCSLQLTSALILDTKLSEPGILSKNTDGTENHRRNYIFHQMSVCERQVSVHMSSIVLSLHAHDA